MSRTFSVMTYNVHSSIGMDGKISPLRIAKVIDQCNPDIVALQELDSGRVRTEMTDQAHLIALTLNMKYHFHSSIQLEEGEYGNAVLSRFPIRLVKAGAVPVEPYNERLERRGAIWTEIEVHGRKLQLIATHLGLNRNERLAQTEAIMGPEWLSHSCCRNPVILCGDFNTLPASPVYRRIAGYLNDAQRSFKERRPRGTWPVHFPILRIDHLFFSPDIKVHNVMVPKNPLTRIASDHLPLVVTLEFL
jgi:endonuclease/exonuclease/phosphatase family metal-dependent hydrolase